MKKSEIQEYKDINKSANNEQFTPPDVILSRALKGTKTYLKKLVFKK